MSRSTALSTPPAGRSCQASELFVLTKETRRLELLRASNSNDDPPAIRPEEGIEESGPLSADATLMITAAENMKLLAKAFHNDDEITIDAPAPERPVGIPSPVGDEPLVLPDLPPTPMRPAIAAAVLAARYDVVPDLPLRVASTVGSVVAPISGIRRSLPPDVVHAARTAREAARVMKADEARTRIIVLTIWGIAVSLAVVLAFVATSS